MVGGCGGFGADRSVEEIVAMCFAEDASFGLFCIPTLDCAA